MAIQRRDPPTIAAVRARRDDVLRIAARHGARNVRVFGSVARGDAIESSDVDILVDMDPEPTGLAYFGRLADLIDELAELLERDVDVVDSASLRRPRMRDRVLREAVPI